MTPDEEEQAQRHRLYEQQCLKYQDEASKSIQEFDRSILTLSSWALGLSLAFIKDVVPLDQSEHLNLLFVSWFLFGSAILLTLFSFVTSQRAFRRMPDLAYKYYILKDDQVFQEEPWIARCTRFLTYAAGSCFLIALVLTLIFAATNIRNHVSQSAIIKRSENQNVKTEKAVLTTPAKKGVDPPKPIQVPPRVIPANPPPPPPAKK